ncbi:MAG TPA: bifunctional glutamate N-acetyltransferase/amino-acid acetyltransferase ArgJ [Acidimicrobiia bacterium]|nr:bifunctional glutamate N-acetyltransferase/amino-acid acetyltransferase ArgJ [Acidimicrobiia bacterium]
MSVVAAEGFRAAGVSAGVKRSGRDVAVVLADAPAVTAAVFTTNQAAGAPVLLDRHHLAATSLMRGVVINSGCANAATGLRGLENAETMVAVAAGEAGGHRGEYLVCSTGTIGTQLPMDAVTAGITEAISLARSDAASGALAAEAIMTTDSVPKTAVHSGGGWVVGGMAKGAGMIRPDMATMLAFVTTDAVVEKDDLQRVLSGAVDRTFNALNIDGCESTNDTVIAMASGRSGIAPSVDELESSLYVVCRDLAEQMARDAEGASRVVFIEVRGARDDVTARYLGRLVADSALVRASFYGGDVNWGRIVGALGTSEEPLDMDAIEIRYHGVPVFRSGVGSDYDERALLGQCEEGDLVIDIIMGDEPGSASVVTTDLTPEYVVFNGERS